MDRQPPPVDEDDPPTTAVESVPEATDLQSPPGRENARTGRVRAPSTPAREGTPKVGSRDAPGG